MPGEEEADLLRTMDDKVNVFVHQQLPVLCGSHAAVTPDDVVLIHGTSIVAALASLAYEVENPVRVLPGAA
jgi:hypothetical protein